MVAELRNFYHIILDANARKSGSKGPTVEDRSGR
jgi:hypothetical protein